jgi:hypothetical protein
LRSFLTFFPLKLPSEFFQYFFRKNLIGIPFRSLSGSDVFSELKLFRRWPIRQLMATLSPISPGTGAAQPFTPVKPAAVPLQPDATSAREDVVDLSPDAVQLIQAAGLSGSGQDQGISEGYPAPVHTLQLVG